MKKISIILSVLLTFVCFLNAQSSPEEAANIFIQGLASGDYEKAISSWAIDDYVQNFDFKAFSLRIKAFTSKSILPGSSQFFKKASLIKREAEAVNEIRTLCYSLSGNNDAIDLSTGKVNPILEPNQVDHFITDTDITKLKSLKYKKIVLLNNNRYENLKKSYEEQAKIYGCSQIAEGVILLELNKTFWTIGFQIFHYPKGWKIYSLSSPLLGLFYTDLRRINESDIIDLEKNIQF